MDKMLSEYEKFKVPLEEKMERFSLIVTKIRGDIIIRN
jgi:hypothetical protein